MPLFVIKPNPDKPEIRNPKHEIRNKFESPKLKLPNKKKLNGCSDPSEAWIDRDLQRCKEFLANKNDNFRTKILKGPMGLFAIKNHYEN
jgi:hypothetical protein